MNITMPPPAASRSDTTPNVPTFYTAGAIDDVDLPRGLDPRGIIARHWYGHHVDADLDPPRRDQLDDVEPQDLRQLWWRLRRLGVQLPAERNIIAIPGGRP